MIKVIVAWGHYNDGVDVVKEFPNGFFSETWEDGQLAILDKDEIALALFAAGQWAVVEKMEEKGESTN